MINFFTKLTAFFLKFVGILDRDSSGGIEFFEILIQPGMTALAEKLGRFGWTFILVLVVAVTVLVLLLVNIRRYEVGNAAAVLIAVGISYLAGHGVMIVALIISVPVALIIRLNRSTQ